MDILVYADWIELGGPALMGTLSVAHTKGREIFSFAYDKAWLDRGLAQNLDPDLQFYAGTQYLSTGKKNFGLFLDSSPDRWGRVLMVRREAISARVESRKTKTLFEEDYLLGVFDAHRMGALRYKKEANGPFLHDTASLASPPWTSLRDLEFASLQLENDVLTDEELSPAFDVNPVYYGSGLTLNISETDNSLDFDLASSVAKYFRVSGKRATAIISQVQQSVSQWQKVAKTYKIPSREQELMAQAFEKSTT